VSPLVSLMTGRRIEDHQNHVTPGHQGWSDALLCPTETTPLSPIETTGRECNGAYLNKQKQHVPKKTKAKKEENTEMADVLAREEAPTFTVSESVASVAARKYVTEFVGAFFLMFAVATAALSGSAFVPLAAGLTLMVMVYAGGHISGGHYNPAVTMAALVRGRIGAGDAVGYWIAQAIGGVVAGAIARAVVNPAAVNTLRLTGHIEAATAVVEILFTFALCYVVLNVATSKDQPNNGFFGLAIGFTVAAGAFAVGGISGGVFNPAVALGGATAGMFGWGTIWVYLLVELAAGVVAGLAFRTLNPTDK
jgi:aquaporin Z